MIIPLTKLVNILRYYHTAKPQGTLRKVLHLSKCLVIIITLVLLTNCDFMGLSIEHSDRLSLYYPPISDAFDNIENFFCIKQMIQL